MLLGEVGFRKVTAVVAPSTLGARQRRGGDRTCRRTQGGIIEAAASDGIVGSAVRQNGAQAAQAYAVPNDRGALGHGPLQDITVEHVAAAVFRRTGSDSAAHPRVRS